MTSLVIVESVAQRILLLRDKRVMLDADLAEMYGVPAKALNQAVRRNMERFPTDFMSQLFGASRPIGFIANIKGGGK